MISQEEMQQFNQEVQAAAKATISRMKSNAPVASGELAQSIKAKFKKNFGMIDRISFTYARHGVYQEIGVGRGQKKGESGDRKAKPFINEAIEWFHEQLQPILDKYVQNATIKAMSIGGKVNG